MGDSLSVDPNRLWPCLFFNDNVINNDDEIISSLTVLQVIESTTDITKIIVLVSLRSGFLVADTYVRPTKKHFIKLKCKLR